MADIRDRIKALMTESEALAAKADLTDADLLRLEAIPAERAAIEREMAARKGVDDVKAWGNKSSGMVALVGSAPAGEATITTETDRKGQKSVLLSDDGDMLIDAKLYNAISAPEYNKAFKSYLRRGKDGMDSNGLKTLNEGIDTAGGFLVPEEMLNRIVSREPASSTVVSQVSTFNTSRDSLAMTTIPYTTDDIYTTGMRVTWTGEIPGAATTHRVTEPTFGQERIAIYTAMMSLPLSLDFVDDAATDVLGWASSKFQETIQLLKANMIWNGSGIGQPFGVLGDTTFVANHVHTGVAAGLGWGGLIDLLYALPEQYDQNSKIYMNRVSTARLLSQLVDGDGRPYWSQANDNGLVGGSLKSPIMGYPVIFEPFLPNVAANVYPIVFGDMRGYYLVNRIGFSIQVLRELYAETNQIVLLGRVRFGGKLVEPWRIRGQFVAL